LTHFKAYELADLLPAHSYVHSTNRCRKAGGKLVRSKELFSLEGGGVERIEDYNSAKSSNQQESDEEAAVYKLTTFNLGTVPLGGGPTAL
jgi:hypothetical protein